jgi:hypothetical protein
MNRGEAAGDHHLTMRLILKDVLLHEEEMVRLEWEPHQEIVVAFFTNIYNFIIMSIVYYAALKSSTVGDNDNIIAFYNNWIGYSVCHHSLYSK